VDRGQIDSTYHRQDVDVKGMQKDVLGTGLDTGSKIIGRLDREMAQNAAVGRVWMTDPAEGLDVASVARHGSSGGARDGALAEIGSVSTRAIVDGNRRCERIARRTLIVYDIYTSNALTCPSSLQRMPCLSRIASTLHPCYILYRPMFAISIGPSCTCAFGSPGATSQLATLPPQHKYH